MKILLPIIAALALVLPVGAQTETHERTTTTTVQQTGRHEGARGGFRVGGHERFEHRHFYGFRGRDGRFDGWRGGFYGEVIVLDDGCYIWTPPGIWILSDDCD